MSCSISSSSSHRVLDLSHQRFYGYLYKNFQQEASLSRLNKKCDVVFIAINDQADKSIFPVGRIGFCANGIGKNLLSIPRVLQDREAYATQWKENRQRLYEITSRFKIPMIELTTESDVHRDLILGLKNIAKRKNAMNSLLEQLHDIEGLGPD